MKSIGQLQQMGENKEESMQEIGNTFKNTFKIKISSYTKLT